MKRQEKEHCKRRKTDTHARERDRRTLRSVDASLDSVVVDTELLAALHKKRRMNKKLNDSTGHCSCISRYLLAGAAGVVLALETVDDRVVDSLRDA